MCKNPNQAQDRSDADPGDFDATKNLDVRGLGPEHVVLDPPCGLPRPLHCLICGQAVEKRQGRTWSVTPCPHLAFVRYAGLYEYASEEFEKRNVRVNDKNIEWDDFTKLLHEAGYGPDLLVIELLPSRLVREQNAGLIAFGFDFSCETELRADAASDYAPAVAQSDHEGPHE